MEHLPFFTDKPDYQLKQTKASKFHFHKHGGLQLIIISSSHFLNTAFMIDARHIYTENAEIRDCINGWTKKVSKTLK